MKRRSRGKSAPRYRHYKRTNQAVVTINGRDIYLGEYDSEESHERYRRALAELWSPTGCRSSKPTPKQRPAEVTIAELCIEYAKFAQGHYRKNGKHTSEWFSVRRALRSFRALYGTLPAVEFGPVRYETMRRKFIDEGLARTTVNRYAYHIRKAFQLAGRLELIPMQIFLGLDSLGNLVEGRTDARETDDVLPADPAIVEATIAELTPTLAAMVRLQLLAGMRPGEVLQLRPCDVDRSAEVWVYKPATHKNEHKKKQRSKIRTVAFGPKAQAVLTPFLFRDAQAFCFTPVESYQQHQERRQRERTTPENQGNRPGYSSRSRSGIGTERNHKPRYETKAYRSAIHRAALRAFPAPADVKSSPEKMAQWKAAYTWNPNQLRHSAATVAREKLGLETAQQVLGHADARMTEKYAEIDLSRAVEFARKYG